MCCDFYLCDNDKCSYGHSSCSLVVKTVAFTGHRLNKVGKHEAQIKFALRRSLKEMKELHGNIRAISGMAVGVDQWAAEVCIELGIPFLAAVPFKGQESVWPEKGQKHYHELLKKAKKIKYVCEPGYGAWKMQKRNEWMVDHCDLLIAVWNGTPGGTANCVKYAGKANRQIYLVDSWCKKELSPEVEVLGEEQPELF